MGMEYDASSADVTAALKELGIKEGDIILVHSSLRSLGKVEDGAAGVIRGLEAAIGKEGTLVMPTLSQVDFFNSYKTWYMDKPSDTGYLTEYFRHLPYVYRSNQETHSVAARGKYAYELTFEHKARGPHMCPFGEWAFADSSPWMKMYHMGAKTLFIGVTMRYNTMKHTVESRYAESLLDAVTDPAKRETLRDEVATFGRFTGAEIWPMYPGQLMHEELDRLGYIKKASCGKATIYCVDMKESSDKAFELLSSDPDRWVNEATREWIRRCRAAAED